MITLWARDRLSGRRLKNKTREYLKNLEQGPVLAAQSAATELLQKMAAEPGPKVCVGETMWKEPVIIPLMDLVKACGLTTGGMGAGKTMFAMLPIAKMISLLPGLTNMSFGVLDAKGELFERALYLLSARLAELHGQEREALLRRIVVIDFSSREAVSPYNILARWPYTDADFFVTSRLETLQELLPAGEKLSLRGATVLKNILTLLTEFNMPLTYMAAHVHGGSARGRCVPPEVAITFEKCRSAHIFPALLRTGRQTDDRCAACSNGDTLCLGGRATGAFRLDRA